jgi:deoxyribodipyrimidine photolyase
MDHPMNIVWLKRDLRAQNHVAMQAAEKERERILKTHTRKGSCTYQSKT